MSGMDFGNPIIWVVVGLIAVALLAVFVVPRFFPKARLERRRRKSNTRIVSKADRPTVKFSVRTKDKK